MSETFLNWVKSFKITLSIAIGIAFFQMLIWKSINPFPNFLPDSYSYIEAAINRKAINIRPIGYSKFLWWFRFITRSHLALVWFQYLLLQASLLYFLFSIWSVLKPSRITFKIILFTTICNPLTFLISNLVSSDTIFTTLSIIWFTQIIRIIYRPSSALLLTHAFILAAIFTVKYETLYYTFISCIIILLGSISRVSKIRAISFISILLLGFRGFTQYNYQMETGRVYFSPYTGWQFASNALYAYSRIPKEIRIKNHYTLSSLQQITDKHTDSIQNLNHRPDTILGMYYLKNEKSPLNRYMNQTYANDNKTKAFSRWALMGVYYKHFGVWIIEMYPLEFLKYFIWPNLKYFFVLKPDFLGSYNPSKTTMDEICNSWFHSNTALLKGSKQDFSIDLTICLSILILLINGLYILSLVALWRLNAFRFINSETKTFLLWSTIIWSSNLTFSVFSGPITIQYQVFSLLVSQFLLIVYVFQIMKHWFLIKFSFANSDHKKSAIS